jgi:hypothetical protein
MGENVGIRPTLGERYRPSLAFVKHKDGHASIGISDRSCVPNRLILLSMGVPVRRISSSGGGV